MDMTRYDDDDMDGIYEMAQESAREKDADVMCIISEYDTSIAITFPKNDPEDNVYTYRISKAEAIKLNEDESYAINVAYSLAKQVDDEKKYNSKNENILIAYHQLKDNELFESSKVLIAMATIDADYSGKLNNIIN